MLKTILRTKRKWTVVSQTYCWRQHQPQFPFSCRIDLLLGDIRFNPRLPLRTSWLLNIYPLVITQSPLPPHVKISVLVKITLLPINIANFASVSNYILSGFTNLTNHTAGFQRKNATTHKKCGNKVNFRAKSKVNLSFWLPVYRTRKLYERAETEAHSFNTRWS